MNSNKENRKKELLQLLQGVDQTQQPVIAEKEAKSDQRDLITQCKSGDRTAFNRLIQQYQDNVYTYISQIVNDEEKAFNASRDAFVEACKTIPGFQGNLSLKAWLLKIAERQVLKASQRQEKWYVALLPVGIYQWYRKMVAKEEPPEAATKAETGECQEIRSLFSAYIDAELRASEITRVETHLDSCGQCSLEYEKLREMGDLVHTFGLIPAPANLQRAVNAVLDTGTLWERCTNYYEKFASMFRFPVPQIAVAVASIAIIFLGIAYFSHREQIRHLEAELRATRGLIRPHPEITPTTFVILTGKIVSEEMPLEAGKDVLDIVPDSDKAEMWSIAGDITSIGDKIVEHIRSLQGEITGDQPLHKNNLTIRHITAELPEHPNVILSRFFQQLAQKPPKAGDPSSKNPISINIYIIDKL